MRRFRIKPISNEREHARALKEIDRLWGAKLGSPEHDLLEVLSILVDGYEGETVPLEDPDPVEAIRFRIDQLGLDRSDLEAILGSRSRVSEVMGRRRKLSLSMIRRLHEELDIPYESLIARSHIGERSYPDVKRAPTRLPSNRRARRFSSGQAKRSGRGREPPVNLGSKQR